MKANWFPPSYREMCFLLLATCCMCGFALSWHSPSTRTGLRPRDPPHRLPSRSWSSVRPLSEFRFLCVSERGPRFSVRGRSASRLVYDQSGKELDQLSGVGYKDPELSPTGTFWLPFDDQATTMARTSSASTISSAHQHFRLTSNGVVRALPSVVSRWKQIAHRTEV